MQETIITVGWHDLLHYGKTYETFTDLVTEAVGDEFDLEAEDVHVVGYGFHRVMNPATITLHVEYEVEEYEEEAYQITPKGRLVLSLIKNLGLDYEQASQIADETYVEVVES